MDDELGRTIRWDRPCYKCLSHYCDLSCPEPAKNASAAPQDATDWEAVSADQAMTIAMLRVDALQDAKDAARYHIVRERGAFLYEDGAVGFDNAIDKIGEETALNESAQYKIVQTTEGYWYVRLDAQRFAQWPVGNKLTLPRCFDSGWWTQAEVDAINKQLGFDLDDAAMEQKL